MKVCRDSVRVAVVSISRHTCACSCNRTAGRCWCQWRRHSRSQVTSEGQVGIISSGRQLLAYACHTSREDKTIAVTDIDSGLNGTMVIIRCRRVIISLEQPGLPSPSTLVTLVGPCVPIVIILITIPGTPVILRQAQVSHPYLGQNQ